MSSTLLFECLLGVYVPKDGCLLVVVIVVNCRLCVVQIFELNCYIIGHYHMILVAF